MEFKGRILKLFPVQSGTSARGTEWTKQDFVFEYFEHETDRWSDKVLLSIMNERITESSLQEGDEVICGFSHNVKEWNGKHFNDVRCYKLEKMAKAKPSNEVPQQPVSSPTASQQAPQSATPAQVANPSTPQQNAQQDEDDGELPF